MGSDFAQLVRTSKYKKVSAAFYLTQSSSNPQSDSFYLRHVGFLGAMPPAVKGLKDPVFNGNLDDVMEFSDVTQADNVLSAGQVARQEKNSFEEKLSPKTPHFNELTPSTQQTVTPENFGEPYVTKHPNRNRVTTLTKVRIRKCPVCRKLSAPRQTDSREKIGIADDVLIASLAKSEGGSDVFYIGSNKEMAREFIEACAMWAVKFNRVAGEIQEEVFQDEDKDILTYVIYFASGYKIKALSSNPKNLRGMQGVVCIDEAAFHEKLAEVLKAALALTMWGAKVRLISTHNGVNNLFNQLIQDSRAGRKSYSVHTITLDDACREGLYQRICQVSKKEWSPS